MFRVLNPFLFWNITEQLPVNFGKLVAHVERCPAAFRCHDGLETFSVKRVYHDTGEDGLMIIEQIPVHTDERGAVFEPLLSAEFRELKNAHIVISNPGSVRGNHFHVRGKELIVIMGPAQVLYRENDQVRDVTINAGDVYRFIFPPGISHAVKNTGSVPIVLAAFNTVTHDPEHPDVVVDELIPI
jgi:dTDP-4-dehydrorhamnose 3,5-epimerase-like enzyme